MLKRFLGSLLASIVFFMVGSWIGWFLWKGQISGSVCN